MAFDVLYHALMQSLVSSAGLSLRKAPGTETVRPWAAASFARDDFAWCEWLHGELDGVRIPPSLRGRASRDGMPYPDEIAFAPDPAGPNPFESLTELQHRAQYLIIVVSPGAGRDPEIAEQMRLFKAGGGEQRIIALVVKGGPDSPAGEPACEEDREWLPKWLAWRFEANRFEPAGPEEPLVIDARPGGESLGEIRMQLLAAILEIPRAELAGLGVGSGASGEVPASDGASGSMPVPAMIFPEPEVEPRRSNLPFAMCGLGFLAVLGFLTLGPVEVPGGAAVTAVPAPAVPAQAPAGTNLPVVAVVPMEAEPLPEFAPPPPSGPQPEQEQARDGRAAFRAVKRPGGVTRIVPERRFR